MNRILKASLLATLATAALLTLSPSAYAHITVNPKEATSGGFAKLTFRVPNERDNAGTVAVEVNLPADHPIAFISVRPATGWTHKVERSKLTTPLDAHGEKIAEAVSKVTWTGGPIGPGEFQEFEISAGPLPEGVDTLVFKALQTYEGGEVVRWIEEATTGGAEPEHPAPVLKLVRGDDDHASPATTLAPGGQAPGDDDTSALPIVAIVIAALALVLGGLALMRARPSQQT